MENKGYFSRKDLGGINDIVFGEELRQAIVNMKKEENKYYTPDIEDIHIGYEFEECIDELSGEFVARVLTLNDLENKTVRYIDEWSGHLYRTPYLTKEQIEGEGWKFKAKSIDLWWEKEGDFEIGSWTSRKIVIHYGMKGHVGNQDCRLYVYAEDQGDEHMLFEGGCKSINEFRYICKLLKIK